MSTFLTMSQNSLKDSFVKVFFQILAEIDMTRNIKIGYLATILKRYNFFFFNFYLFFFRIMIL